MKITTIFDSYIFPALDYLQVDCMRHGCTQISAVVRDLTGYWIHPAFWEIDAGLILILIALLHLRRKFAPRPQQSHGTVG